ncbi:MAG: hypothetical protein ACLUQ6_03930, partial [Alistipes onderdonkii]
RNGQSAGIRMYRGLVGPAKGICRHKSPDRHMDPETQTEAVANGPIIGYASKFNEETTPAMKW